MDLAEGVGESSSPPRSFVGYDIRTDVYNRLIEKGNVETTANPGFKEILDAHFSRLPSSYGMDVNMDRVEDVLIHRQLLMQAKDPSKRPAYYIRFLERLDTGEHNDSRQYAGDLRIPQPSLTADDDGDVGSHARKSADSEACAKLEDLNLNIVNNSRGMGNQFLEDNFARRVEGLPIHEVIFSTTDKPKLLSQLSALLSDIGLNIREAHVFSTTDGYSLDVFVVDGWPVEDTAGLYEAMGKAIMRTEGSWSRSPTSHSAVEKALATNTKPEDWEIDKRLLKIEERIASGSCGDLYRGVYLGEDVAIKILRSELLNEALEAEFSQEVAILREVHHKNVVRFIGAYTKAPNFCIVTEYMSGGSLYDFLHKNHHDLRLHQLLRFAIDICKGMTYLHQNNIIHRDLKTANLLLDANKVVKVADFGVARFQNQGGVMTAETGTYRWMAPEVINHQPYNHKADIFSFAIVLWEIVTAKVPYDKMTPLQAALGVRQVCVCRVESLSLLKKLTFSFFEFINKQLSKKFHFMSFLFGAP
uniref:non-specific serine/threonine protein kinase n=1 Tax=Kalanchoe fedtschenkoi TaxID=63787 RepID=A0A7N0UDN1_KALFE